MNTEQDWLLATLKREDGDVLARFAYHHRYVIGDPSYSRTAWFELESSSVVDLDLYLGELDKLEDRIRARIESSMKSQLILVLSGAGYRDLVFALKEDDFEAQVAIDQICSECPDQVSVKVHQGQSFGPFSSLVAWAARKSN